MYKILSIVVLFMSFGFVLILAIALCKAAARADKIIEYQQMHPVGTDTKNQKANLT